MHRKPLPNFSVWVRLFLVAWTANLFVCGATAQTPHKSPPSDIPNLTSPVIDHKTLFYTLTDTIPCSRFVHDSLMDDLPLSAQIANVLHKRKYELTVQDSAIVATDHDGLDGVFVVAHRSEKRFVYYGEGSFKKTFILSISGRAIVDIHCPVIADTSQTIREMALYLKVDSGTVGFMAKIASKLPLLGSLVKKFAIKKALSFARISSEIAYALHTDREGALQQLESMLSATDYAKLTAILEADAKIKVSGATPYIESN